MKQKHRLLAAVVFAAAFSLSAAAQVLPQAEEGMRIPLVAKPTSRPMGVAYIPASGHYAIADGGLAPLPDGMGLPMSPSEVRVYSAQGELLQVVKPGLDNRSLYFNPNANQLEAITYNISSGAGFTPNSGIFGLLTDDKGQLSNRTSSIAGHHPAFGDAATAPSYDPAGNRYLAKQERSNKVLIVALDKPAPVGEISLDLAAAGAKFDDISDHFVAFTGVPGKELALLDIDHKAVLVFDIKGRFVGKSALPAKLKLRANNHYNGNGYANGMYFVYHEPEGEFGVYYGFRIFAETR